MYMINLQSLVQVIFFWLVSGKNFTTVEKNVSAGLTVASNYSNIIEFASNVWTQAQEKYRTKAFLHWYWKYGCEEVSLDL